MLHNQILNYQNKLFNTETKEHIENVSSMALFLAGFFNFTDNELYNIRNMSLLHDIGKVKIPLYILERNGPLTDEEYKLVKRHSEFGRDILREFGFKDDELAIIYQHHERCNGSGYPLGLKKEEIKLEAKIVQVVDVIDALLSDRVYKKAWNKIKVKKYIKENEEAFCKDIVDIVLDNFEELISLRK